MRRFDLVDQKVTNVLYFPSLGESPAGLIRPKRCMVGDVRDVITCAKFEIEIFVGYDFTGVEFLIFLLIFTRALQQCSANVLPLITTSGFACSQSQRLLLQESRRPSVQKLQRPHCILIQWGRYDTCECIDDGTLREVFPIDYLVMGGVVFSAAVIVIIVITAVTALKHPRTAGRYFTARQFPCF